MRTALLLVFTTALAGAVEPIERMIRIDVPDHDVVYTLARQTGITVTDAQDRHIDAYADDAAITRVRALGYKVTVLAEDYTSLSADLVDYHTYMQVCSIVTAQALAHPGIAELETLGMSAGGRPIPAMKITVDPTAASARPRARIIGTHHGNEKISTEVTLSFLQYLCDNYEADPRVRCLVDNREIWVIPVFNPDGHVSNQRGNANGSDLNRDYGYEWEVYSSPFTQPETRAMHRHAELHVPTVEYSYHSTASYVNYLWDNTPIDPPDSAWIIALSQRYADSTYGTSTTRLQPINGWDWYEVHGSCQDDGFGTFGALAWTIETRYPSSNRVRIDSICFANRRALLDMIVLSDWGINGVVHDSLTGSPLFARVEITNPRRWHTYTQAGSGDFHKMVAPGTYSLRVASNGYVTREFTNVVVPDTGGVVLDVPLTRPQQEPPNFAQRISTVKRTDDNHVLPGVAIDVLGAPDSRYYRIGPGSLELLLDPFTPCRNREGNDITVYAVGTYTVSVANNPFGPWASLGTGSGEQSFDLAAQGLDSALYLRLVENTATEVDAVSYVGSARVGGTEAPNPIEIVQVSVRPNPARARATMLLGPHCRDTRVRVVDVAGRAVRTLAAEAGSRHAEWDLRDNAGKPAPDGIYFCIAETARGAVSARLSVSR